MSNISELREQVTELNARLEVVEKLLLDSIKRGNIQDLNTEMTRIEEGDTRTPIGFKVTKE